MPKSSQQRNLIKFSRYSTCLILPKKMLAVLEWGQGDSVVVTLDRENQRLLITHPQPQKARSAPATPDSKFSAAVTIPDEDGEDILPIPELNE